MRGKAIRPDYTARPGEAVRVFRDGGGDFEIGVGRIVIAPDDSRHVEDVVEDLRRLVHCRDGEEALKEGDALGRRVKIVKPDPPTDPPNAWTVPEDLAAAVHAGVALGGDGAAARIGTGAGCASTIVYDPADWPRPGDPHSPTSDSLLLLMLRQANRNARGESDPSQPGWGTETEGRR